MRAREAWSYFGGMAAASAFHEFSHHAWTLSTTIAVVTATLTLVMVFMGPVPKASASPTEDPK